MSSPISVAKISVIIVNYNSASYALDCIQSLEQQQNVTLEIILVDNNSTNDSVAQLTKNLNKSVKFIRNQENLGFGRANNLAAKLATGDFFLLLNPDTKITSPNALHQLVAALIKKSNVGLMSPAIYEPRKNKYAPPRFSYPSSSKLKFTDKIKNLPGDIAWVLGACMLLRREVFEQMNGFDPDYFLYGEDADICLRLRLAGYEIGHEKQVEITHVSGASELGADSLDKWLRKKSGVVLFFNKHYHPKDFLTLAKTTILKSKLYLVGTQLNYQLLGLFKTPTHAQQAKFLDKKHRLEATIMAFEAYLKSS